MDVTDRFIRVTRFAIKISVVIGWLGFIEVRGGLEGCQLRRRTPIGFMWFRGIGFARVYAFGLPLLAA